MPVGSMAESLPLGPSTRTVLPCMVYFTLAGNGIGFFPIRDIVLQPFVACESRPSFSDRSTAALPQTALPDLAENLAADAFAPGLPAGHHAARRGHDADAHAALHALDFIAANIHAASGT